MVDIDRFICSLINQQIGQLSSVTYNHVQKALAEQGLEYKDGAIKLIEKEGNHVIIDAGFGSLTVHFNEEEMEAFKEGLKKKPEKKKPKFKVGDWVVNKFGDSWHIDSYDKKNYQVSNGNEYNYFPISKQNEMHLWTIQDAKNGDVLSDGTTIFIFKDLLSDGSVMPYCDYNTDSGDSDAFCPLSVKLMCSKITPATKEQRDTLERAMTNAGYRWNTDTLILEKVENTSTIKFDEPDIDAMVEEYWNNEDRLISSHTRAMIEEAYRKGLEDMYKRLKG